jgi:hypothetical protein
MIYTPAPFLPNIVACPHAIVSRIRRNYNSYRANPGGTAWVEGQVGPATTFPSFTPVGYPGIDLCACCSIKNNIRLAQERVGNYKRHQAKPGDCFWETP